MHHPMGERVPAIEEPSGAEHHTAPLPAAQVAAPSFPTPLTAADPQAELEHIGRRSGVALPTPYPPPGSRPARRGL